jgi:hypothetical protein
MSMLETKEERILPKVAVRSVFTEPSRSGEEKKLVYDVEYPQKSISGGDSYTREIIGYVETEPYTLFDRCENFREFVDQIEAKSRYHSWIPERFTHPEETAFGGDVDV